MSVLKAQARECANLSQQLRMLLNDSTPDELATLTSRQLDKILPQLRDLVLVLDAMADHSVISHSELPPEEGNYDWFFDHGCGD